MVAVNNLGMWRGVALPWGPSIKSFIEPKSDEDVLRSSIIWILLTRKNERVMLPEFGSDIPDAVFELNDDTLLASLTASANEAIGRWDDRIEITDFTAEREENTLRIKVAWKNITDPVQEEEYVTGIELTPAMLSSLV